MHSGHECRVQQIQGAIESKLKIAVLRFLIFITKDVQLFNDSKGRGKGMLEVHII